MAMKSKELMPDSTVRMLDTQAYAMHEFINLFFKDRRKSLARFTQPRRYLSAAIEINI